MKTLVNIVSVMRLVNDRDGNPRWCLIGQGNERLTTDSNSAVGHTITPDLRGWHAVQMENGRVVGLTPVTP